MSPSEQKDAQMQSDWGAALGESLAGALVGEQGLGGTAHANRVLNQDEITTLMAGGGQGGQSGLERIISSGLVSYDRLPMLEIMFDRLVRIMSTSLRNFTWDNVEVAIDNIASQRFGDYLDSMSLPAMMGVFKVREWDNYGLVVLDSAMIYSVVDVLLGGRRGTSAMRIEGRPYTTIERTLVQRLLNVVLADISTAFTPLAESAAAELSPALWRERALLEARARAAQGQGEVSAFGALGADGDEALAEFLAERRDFAGAAAALGRHLDRAVQGLSAPLQPSLVRGLVRQAALLALAEDAPGLSRLRAARGPILAGSPGEAAFNLLTSDPVRGLADLPRLQHELELFRVLPARLDQLRIRSAMAR